MVRVTSSPAGDAGHDETTFTTAPSSAQSRSFGAIAEAYDRVRPGYPAALVDWAVGTERRRLVDLGAGTGKLTRVLLQAGHEVVAVEPDEEMRRQLAGSTPGADVVPGTGEDVPLPDASVDAVLVAQAWHWMDPARAAAELARILRPGGALVLVWNLRDPGHRLQAGLVDVLAEASPDLLDRLGNDVDRAERMVDVPGTDLRFDADRWFDNTVRYSPEQLVLLASTWSYVALSPRRSAVLAGVAELASRLVDPDGLVEYGQRTRAFRFLRD